jgi:hypothetical protein
VGAIAAA